MNKIDWSFETLKPLIERYISARSCLIALGIENPFGGYYAILNRKIKEYNLDTSHWLGKSHNKINKLQNKKRDISHYLTLNCTTTTSNLKNRLLKEGYLKYECSKCFLGDTWQNAFLALHLDHINGNNKDCRIENLRLLCPNCHNQTTTYCGKKNFSKSYFCIDCNVVISKHSSRCKSCAKNVQRTTKIQWPSKEELEKLVWKQPTSQISKTLGVSDKAIEKHCKKLGIAKPPRGYWMKLVDHEGNAPSSQG